MDDSAQLNVLPPSFLRASQFQDILLWLLRQRQRFRVVGNSMQPLLQPQDEVLLNPYAYRNHWPRPGDLVVTRHPYQANIRLIKWVVYRDDNNCFLKGLNPAASTDSRNFGLVPRANLLGQVVCRFP